MRVRPILLLAGVFLLAGCRGREADPPQMCTLMGCLDSLTVTLEGEVPADYTLQLTSADGPPLVVSCTSAENAEPPAGQSARCEGSSVTFGVAPAQVNVRLTWEGGALEKDLTPVYESFQPNGPDCPPVCRAGSVTIVIP